MARNIPFLVFLGIFLIIFDEASAIINPHQHPFPRARLVKRDVLKSGGGRVKRYADRIPLTFNKKFSPYEYEGGQQQQPSHFREYQGEEQAPLGPNRLHRTRDLLDDTSNLSDDDIQTLLLMLEGYRRRTQGSNPGYYSNLSPLVLDRMYGSPAARQQQQAGPGNDNVEKLEFLRDVRSKRTGARHLRETDPLDQASLVEGRPKKSIDWSHYFGYDKRSPTQPPSSPKDAPPKKVVKDDKASAKKKEEKTENETVDKTSSSKDEKPDKQWMLQEFYKNFAMMTNVRKRKRESPPPPQTQASALEDLENKMNAVGDKLIFDTLKYSGAHRDMDLSSQELARVKQTVIDKLATAYSLEKVRQAVDELRTDLEGMNNNIHQEDQGNM